MIYEYICKYCLKKTSKNYVKPSWIKKGTMPLFCSNTCRTLASRKRIQFKCANCECEIERHPSDLKNNKTGFYFCGKNCQNIYASLPNEYKTGGAKIHYEYTNYRKKAIQAFGDKCELCFWEHTIEVHHIDGNRDNNELKNLCVLCPNCHSLTESNKYCISNKNILIETEEKIKNLRNKLNQ